MTVEKPKVGLEAIGRAPLDLGTVAVGEDARITARARRASEGGNAHARSLTQPNDAPDCTNVRGFSVPESKSSALVCATVFGQVTQRLQVK